MEFKLIGLDESYRYLVKFPKEMTLSEVMAYAEGFRTKFPGMTFHYLRDDIEVIKEEIPKEVEENEQLSGETNNTNTEQ